jgi:hypothetical protein
VGNGEIDRLIDSWVNSEVVLNDSMILDYSGKVVDPSICGIF